MYIIQWTVIIPLDAADTDTILRVPFERWLLVAHAVFFYLRRHSLMHRHPSIRARGDSLPAHYGQRRESSFLELLITELKLVQKMNVAYGILRLM